MVNLDRVLKEFEYYVSDFDLTEKSLKYKYEHSKRVMNVCIDIATNIGLSIEEVQLAGLIGLLHDIGRFEQYTLYKTFNDHISFDHGQHGVEILFKNDYIREFVTTNEYDEIIKKSISFHNKYTIGECNRKEFLFSQIVRDADKIDIYRYYVHDYVNQETNDIILSDHIYDAFLERKSICFEKCKTDVDKRILTLAMIYDLNFKYSIDLVKKNNYSDILFDRYMSRIKCKETVEKFSILKQYMSEFLEKR